MKAYNLLPEGYKEIYSIDLKKNKAKAFLVNGLAVLIAAIMAVLGSFHISILSLYDMSDGMAIYIIRLVSVLVLLVIYMVLHELVHGIAMKMCGTKKVKYGFTGVYAFAGSDDYYDKKSYIFIALAPVVLWGMVLAIVNFFVPNSWFWVIYIIQIGNISGAAGDFYVTYKFSRLPKDILIKDYGVGMKVYSAIGEKNEC